MKKVLLLGAAGQLGTDIIRFTSSDSIEIRQSIRADFDADIDSVDKKLLKYKDVDYIINCIAYHKVDQCEDNSEQAFAINSKFVLDLSLFASEHNITLIHISTDYVFDGMKNNQYKEVDEPNALNIYGESKFVGEQRVKAYARNHFVLRISSLFGSKETDNPNINFVEKMIHAAKSGTKLKVIDNQIISPTHTKDVALVIKHIIDKEFDSYGTYHCCNSGTCSWYQFVEKIFALSHLTTDLTPVSYDSFHTHAKRPQYCAMDNSKLTKFYKMKNWEEALEEYLELKGHRAK